MLTLDILGISLALLDFTGTARKAEERLRYVTKRQRKRAKIYRRWIFDLKGTSGFWGSFWAFTRDVLIMLIIALCIVHVFDWWPGLKILLSYVPSVPEPKVLIYGVLIILAPAIWIGVFIVNSIVGGFIVVACLTVFHRLMWLMSLPKAGIIGTLGLLLPLTTATLNALSLA